MMSNKQLLTDLDAALGDGDLGLTMSKGFAHLATTVSSIQQNDLGKLIYNLGTELANTVPSTMGTLMASGLMSAGKALRGKELLKNQDLATFLDQFTLGVMNRGKAKPGEKTVLDSLYPAAQSLNESIKNGEDIHNAMQKATEASKQGLEETVNMKSTYGKAAVFQEKSIGKQDPGATVGWLLISGINDVILNTLV